MAGLPHGKQLAAAAVEDTLDQETAIQPVVEDPIEEIMPDLVEAEANAAVPMPIVLTASITRQRQRFAEQQERDRQRDRSRREQQQAQATSPQTAPRSVEAENSLSAAAPQQTKTTRRLPNISPQQWQSQVIAHLNRAKCYPSDARSRREEGIPHLQFAIDQTGKVLSARIVRSSGIPALDQAALVPGPSPAIIDHRPPHNTDRSGELQPALTLGGE